jgi:hypothetical protein
MTLASTVAGYLANAAEPGIDGAKTAVIAALEATNSGAEFHATDYFNHSFIPDIVATWSGAIDEAEQRFIFLRPNHLPAFVQADVQRLADLKPSFVILTEEDPDLDEIEGADDLRLDDTAIANTYALDVLGAPDGRLRREHLASTLFLRQARGIIGRVGASTLDAAAGGFNGAIEGDADTVSASLQVFSRFLQDDAAASINRAMYYMWQGATAKQYPGVAPIDGWLEPSEVVEILRHLLQRSEIISPQYWERLAEHVTLDELQGLETLESSESLQELMRFASSRLLARAVHVDAESSQPSFAFDQAFEWSVRDRFLQLSNQKTIFRFADDLRRFGGIPGDIPCPTMDSLRLRLQSLQLEEIAIRTDGLVADFRLEGDGTLAVRRDLDEVVSDLDPGAEVHSVSVRRVQGGASFDCDFRRSILQSAGEANQVVSDFALVAARLLGGLDNGEISRLRVDLGLHTATSD